MVSQRPDLMKHEALNAQWDLYRHSDGKRIGNNLSARGNSARRSKQLLSISLLARGIWSAGKPVEDFASSPVFLCPSLPHGEHNDQCEECDMERHGTCRTPISTLALWFFDG